MNRRDFLAVCGVLGITAPSFATTNKSRNTNADSVLIVGGGAAGLTAGYLLKQQDISFRIVEASSSLGGRMKRTKSFVDFPIPLGAEWLHMPTKELDGIVDGMAAAINPYLQGYSGRETIGYYEDGVLHFAPLYDAFGKDFADKKFINFSWFDFFEEYVVTEIRENILLDTEIKSINYAGDHVNAIDGRGAPFQADHLIVTVPLKVLQQGRLSFVPPLPRSKRQAIQNAPVWGGLKIFIEFSKQFYPTYLAFPDSDTPDGQRLYYDASYAQNTNSSVLGLFAVGAQARRYQDHSRKDQLTYILRELDEVFEGAATRYYKQHVIQDWDQEAFIHSAYLADGARSYFSSDLFAPVEERIHFAGEAYTDEDAWGSVHNAARSARDAVAAVVYSLG